MQQDKQRGGDFPVFRGARNIQYDNGFADVLRGFLLHVLPAAVKRGRVNVGEPNGESGIRAKIVKGSKRIIPPCCRDSF